MITQAGISGETAAVLSARVARCACGELSARVLPRLALGVPMEAQLRKLGGNFARLLLRELNPNPTANNLRKLIHAAQTTLQQVENLLGLQLAIGSRCSKSI